MRHEWLAGHDVQIHMIEDGIAEDRLSLRVVQLSGQPATLFCGGQFFGLSGIFFQPAVRVLQLDEQGFGPLAITLGPGRRGRKSPKKEISPSIQWDSDQAVNPATSVD